MRNGLESPHGFDYIVPLARAEMRLGPLERMIAFQGYAPKPKISTGKRPRGLVFKYANGSP
jgi:hypothetical protein